MTKSLDITVIRRGDHLTASAPVFDEDIRSLPEGQEFHCSIYRERNPEQHRFFFAILHEMIDAGLWDGDIESLLEQIKIGTGHFRVVIGAPQFAPIVTDLAREVLANGHADEGVIKMANAIANAGPRMHFIPKSIAFAKLSQDDFQKFLRRVERYIAKEFGVDVEELIKRAKERAAIREIKRSGRRREDEQGPVDGDEKIRQESEDAGAAEEGEAPAQPEARDVSGSSEVGAKHDEEKAQPPASDVVSEGAGQPDPAALL